MKSIPSDYIYPAHFHNHHRGFAAPSAAPRDVICDGALRKIFM